jgi:hypothetical protein
MNKLTIILFLGLVPAILDSCISVPTSNGKTVRIFGNKAQELTINDPCTGQVLLAGASIDQATGTKTVTSGIVSGLVAGFTGWSYVEGQKAATATAQASAEVAKNAANNAAKIKLGEQAAKVKIETFVPEEAVPVPVP